MKTSNNISALLLMCLMLMSGIFMTSCSDDEYSTNQYTGGVKLNVFGPCPVARGGELRFLGVGMNQIQSIDIPGSDPITDIDVINNEEARIIVPQSAEPGLLTIHTSAGDIQTKTPISFTEPISFDTADAITPNPIKPGEELTINGEYLNLIKEVIFAEGITVSQDQFTAHDRKQIKLIVPEQAQTGKIIISDGAEIPNWIYSKDEIQIVLPSVTETLNLTNVKPGTVVKLYGKNLDLIKQVVMPNGDNVEYKVGSEGSFETLIFTLPTNATDGAICMIPASGVKIAVANIGLALPKELVVTPKTELRGGDEITIKGVNMDLVTSVIFPNVADAVKPASVSATEVKVVMPEKTTSGEMVINTASGKSVTAAIETAKPKNLGYANATVPAGGILTITGANLDLISSITFGGEVELECVSATNATELKVQVPTTAESGVLVLHMANGESVEAPEITVTKPECAWIPTLPEKYLIGAVTKCEIVNGDKLTGVTLGGQSVQYICSEGELSINVTTSFKEGQYDLVLTSTNGSITYNVKVAGNEETLWEGNTTITWGDGGRVVVLASKLAKAKAGQKLILYYSQKDQTWAQAQLNNGSWAGIPFPEVPSGTLIPTDIYGWSFADRATELTLTQDILDNIQANKSVGGDFDGAGIIIQGSDLTFTKITLK